MSGGLGGGAVVTITGDPHTLWEVLHYEDDHIARWVVLRPWIADGLLPQPSGEPFPVWPDDVRRRTMSLCLHLVSPARVAWPLPGVA